MNAEQKKLIKQIVKETIAELRRAGMLKDGEELAYSEISEILKSFYQNGQNDEKIKAALVGLEGDRYFKIIPLYYSYGYTLEDIAEVFDVDLTTITRNKKRLCLEIFNRKEV